MTDELKVEVKGLDAFRKDLRRLNADFPKKLAVVHKEIAEAVAERARGKAQALGGVAAKAAPSIKSRKQAAGATIGIGSTKYPFALGAEFGSITYKQFPDWRGSGPGAGYFLYPAIRESREETMAKYELALIAITKNAFPE